MFIQLYMILMRLSILLVFGICLIRFYQSQALRISVPHLYGHMHMHLSSHLTETLAIYNLSMLAAQWQL